MRTTLEVSAGGTVGPFDFESVARIIDTVAGYDPARLSTLLAILWHSRFKAEARGALQAAVTCRDPLAGRGSICVDAPASQGEWHDPEPALPLLDP